MWHVAPIVAFQKRVYLSDHTLQTTLCVASERERFDVIRICFSFGVNSDTASHVKMRARRGEAGRAARALRCECLKNSHRGPFETERATSKIG